MNYYDPSATTSFFRTQAQIHQATLEKKEKEKEEKWGTIDAGLRIGATPFNILESNRQDTLMQTALKQGIRDPDSPTGFKYEEIPDSVFDKDRRKYDPRKLTDYFKKRYRGVDKRIQEVVPFESADTTKSVEEAKRFTQFNDPVKLLKFPQTGSGTLGFSKPEISLPNRINQERGFGVSPRDSGTSSKDPWRGFKREAGWDLPIEPRRFDPGQQIKATKPLVNTKSGSDTYHTPQSFVKKLNQHHDNLDKTGDLNDLIRKRNASKGEDRKVLQSQINELYEGGGGTFEGADELLKTRSAADTAMTGLGTAGSAIEAVGTAKNLYDIASSNATGGKKLKAVGETGLDYASSAMIGSGNPYGVAGGLAIKGGKALWDMLT